MTGTFSCKTGMESRRPYEATYSYCITSVRQSRTAKRFQ